MKQRKDGKEEKKEIIGQISPFSRKYTLNGRNMIGKK